MTILRLVSSYLCLILWSIPVLSWVFLDPGDTQSAYQIQIDNNSDFSSPEIDTGKVSNSSNTYSPLNLSYNTAYYWRVKVWDSKDAVSSWASGSQFATEKHSYPLIDFSWLPANPMAQQNVLFTDQSTVYGGASKKSWSWNFEDGSPSNSNQQNPTTKFRSTGLKEVMLQATDSDNYACSDSKIVPVQSILPFPQFKEILPF